MTAIATTATTTPVTLAEEREARTIAGEFPADFVFGAATASYQIEGAAAEDGRTPSIWDTFSARPGAVRNGDTGAEACDHYHRYREDVALMRDLGLSAYRFSLSWSRLFPHGGETLNPDGLAFYDRLVDELLEAGIAPWVTLYHWDLPQEIEDAGGWPARDTAERFAAYAHRAASALGDRVQSWTTLNEPWCSAFLGYGSGMHAPGAGDHTSAVLASHHLLLGHGLAVPAVRAAVPGADVGITLNLAPAEPATPGHPGCEDAARRLDGLQNRWFLDPLFAGHYPEDILRDLGEEGRPAWLLDGDLETIGTPLDFVGVNYYSSAAVRPSSAPGVNVAEVAPRFARERTGNGWEIDADGLTETLVRVSRDYTDLPVYVTENGSAWPDEVDADGSVHDTDRLDYLIDHLRAGLRAREQGARLAGYFAWSLLDNFEWAEGYTVRFGLIRVDYATQRRTVKDSGQWYAELLAAHRDRS